MELSGVSEPLNRRCCCSCASEQHIGEPSSHLHDATFDSSQSFGRMRMHRVARPRFIIDHQAVIGLRRSQNTALSPTPRPVPHMRRQLHFSSLPPCLTRTVYTHTQKQKPHNAKRHGTRPTSPVRSYFSSPQHALLPRTTFHTPTPTCDRLPLPPKAHFLRVVLRNRVEHEGP